MTELQYLNSSEFRRLFEVSKMTQTEATLEYMKRYGSITPLEALNAFGCLRLSARIAGLREDGYVIDTAIAEGKKKYAIYSLRQEEAV